MSLRSRLSELKLGDTRVVDMTLRQWRSAAIARVQVASARASYHRYREELLRGEEPTLTEPVWQLATHAQIHSPEFELWVKRLNLPMHRHRKIWEYAYIMQALETAGMLREGVRGVGFGVGREPLASYMAHVGCKVVATDLDASQATEKGWRSNNAQYAQHAALVEELNIWKVCDPEVCARNITFRFADMTAPPDDLTDFDFVWSSCAFEHLGSIEKGLTFVERSIDMVRPGGVAVHTTEFNLSSDDDTLNSGDTVLYRRRDILALAERLRARGHDVAPINLHPGQGRLDLHVDLPPYAGNQHVKLLLLGYVTTSIGLVIRRAKA